MLSQPAYMLARLLLKAGGSANAGEKELAACCTILEDDKQAFSADSRSYVSSRHANAEIVTVKET